MQQLVDKARVLMEALPYMRRFMGRTIVVKYGGHAMTDDSYQASFAADVVLLKHIGLRPVIVHGGGPQIEATLARMGKKSAFVDGRRITEWTGGLPSGALTPAQVDLAWQTVVTSIGRPDPLA